MPPRATLEDLEQTATAQTPATSTRQPWQIYSYRRRRTEFLIKWEAWRAQEQARLRAGLPETSSEQQQRHIMETQKALVDQAIAHSNQQQAIRQANSATPRATPRTAPRLTAFNTGTKRHADTTTVTNEGSPMKKQRVQPPKSPSPTPKEPEQQPSPGRTFQVPSDDEDTSMDVSIGKTFAVPEYSDSEDDSMEDAEAAEAPEAPEVSEAAQKKRKRIEDEEQELERREEENVRRALRLAETEKELNRLHAEQVEKQKAAMAPPPAPAWTQPPPPTPSPQHAQLPKPAPIPAPQNKYAPKKPSRLRESTTYSPVRQSIEEDVITIPTPKQHGFLFGSDYLAPPSDEEIKLRDKMVEQMWAMCNRVSPVGVR